MNHRETPSLPTGVCRALHCLSLLLLPNIAPLAAPASPRHRHDFGHGADGQEYPPMPYLAFVGGIPLRVQKIAKVGGFSPKPVASGALIPSLDNNESAIALANAAAAQSAKLVVANPPSGPAPKPNSSGKRPAAKNQPTSILPDDTRPTVSPEDFLPYFQLPGSRRQNGEVNVIVPLGALTAPPSAPLPPSTATYRQTP